MPAHIELPEKLASIDRALAQHDWRRQQIEYELPVCRLEVSTIVVTALTAGASLFAAGAVFMKLLGV